MVFVSSRKKQGWEFFYKSKKSRCTTMISQININESNNLNTSNSDNIIGTSNLPNINFQNGCPFNTVIIFLNKLIQSEVLV